MDADTIFTTSDGGNTWTKAATGLKLEKMDFKKLIFANEKAGWIIGREKDFLKTTDRGITWEKATDDQAKQK